MGVLLTDLMAILQSLRVGAVKREWRIHYGLDGFDQPGQVVGFLIGISPGVDIQPGRAGIRLSLRQVFDEFRIPFGDGLCHPFAGSVYFFTDDFHGHSRRNKL